MTCSYEFRLRVALSPRGDLILTSRIKNISSDGKPFQFTFAYHTYFSVSDIRYVARWHLFDLCFHQAIFSISYVPVIADRNLLQYWLTLNMSDVELITFRFRLRVHYYFVRKSKSFSFGKQRDCTRGTSCIWMQSLSHYNLSLCLSISNIVSANRSCRSPDRFTCTIGYFLFPCPETCFHIPVKCG